MGAQPTLVFAQPGARTEAFCKALEAASLNPRVVGDDERLTRELEGAAAVIFSCLDAPAVAPGEGPEHVAEQYLAVQRELVDRPLGAFTKIAGALQSRPVPVVWLTPALTQGSGAVEAALGMAAVSLQSWATLFAAQHAERGIKLTTLSPGSADVSREIEQIRQLVLPSAQKAR